MQWQAISRFCNFALLPPMINRVKSWKIIVCFAICASGLNCAPPAAYADPSPAPAPPVVGIGEASDELSAQALDLFNKGKLAEAADAYTTLLTKFTNSGDVPEAEFRLGYILYVQGVYDKAVAMLNKITSPPATPEIKAAGDALIPQVLAAQATKMDPADPKRKAAFKNAIAQFDAFIQKYPKSPQVESANYGRAVAAFQDQDYDEAIKSLQTNLTQFATSESILDSEDLLAVVLTAQATDELKAHGDAQTAMTKFGQALGYLSEIINSHKDVALANDAQFQAGEVLYNRGNAQEGDKRTKDLSNAISVYREVLPKEMMVQAQQARVDALLPRLQQAVLTRNQAQVQVLQQLQDRENAKLQALKDAPDQSLNAQLRIASCYFLLERFNETRVLLNYLVGFADDEGQKKQIHYYIVLTYARQGLLDQAVATYNDFQSKYKGDPMGESLPIALGQAFLGATPSQPEKAIPYFKDEMTLYPKSPLVNDALGMEANALIGLQKYDDAFAAYQKFLQTNPPTDQAAQAEQGIALVYQQTGKLPEAIKQYRKVADTYPQSEPAEQCAFYAAGLEISVDMKQALPDLQAFVKKYPDGKFTSQAMYMIGQVQSGMGDTAAATQSFKDVVTKFPKSDAAPQAIFQQASILGTAGKTDDMVKLLQDFIATYPDNKDVYFAYNTIGQAQVKKEDVPAAIATYTEMADKHADNPMAGAALLQTIELWRKQADTQGRYLALNEVQRKEWGKDLAASIAAAERMLDQFPTSDQLGLALKALLVDERMLLAAKQKTPEDIDKYFHDLADKYGKDPSLKSHILFTLATFTYEKDPAKGLAEMAEAYNPALVYAPGDMDLYGQALLDQGKADDAYKIYDKLAKDYPTPAGVQPAQAPTAVQEAQATALFGMGTALDKQGKPEDAGKLYDQLKTTYPWSPKVVEANYGIAKLMIAQNKPDDALKLLVGVVSNRNASATVRAHAMVLIGDIYAAKGNVEQAIDAYLKAAAYYGGVPDAAAEGLFKGSQMLEQQASLLNEQSTPKKSEQIAKAVANYKDIITKYPNSKYVQQAQDRLNALGAK